MDDVITVQARGLSEKQAMERVIQFAQRFGPLHGDLAAHAAFPLVLTPDLLYRMWASFLPQIPWTTVSDILLSPLCREVGYELYEMDPAIRNILLGELKEDSRFGESRLRELAQFLRDYIRADLQADDPDQRELADAQRITALAHTEPDEAARQIASKISDLSQLTGADLLRVATLTETLAQPLREYSPLVAYARGVERLAHGDRKAASNLFNRVFEEKQDIKIGDVTLSRPRRAPEPIQAQAKETGIPEAPKIFTQAVYISYAWGGESEEIVNQIDQALGQRGLKIIRDKRDLGYKASISTFMERTGQANYVIVVISDKYLRSPTCMIELVEIANHKEFHDRLFPILLSDADIYDPVGRLEYVRHWESKRAELAQAMKQLDPANLQGIRDDMDLYDRIRDTISGLTSLLTDMNSLTPEIHRESDFSDLYNAIERRIKAGPAAVPDVPIPGTYFEPEMILIPEGPFRMGSTPGKGISGHETPQHEVSIPAYRIGKYPVTNAQYGDFIRETGKPVIPPGSRGQGAPEGMENHPVMGVTWYEALEYCQWLSQKTGRHYSLPNEAQWEKACRGGGNSLYPWGDTFDPLRCNAGQRDIAPVNSYPPQNDFGGFDFVGNVRQWTCTLWGENRDAPDPRYSYPWGDDGRNDVNANRQVRRVLRGSSFSDGTRQAYCSFRSGQVPDERGVAGAGCGFRVVMIDSEPSEISGNIHIGGDVSGNINIDYSFEDAPQTSTSPHIGSLTRQISLTRDVNVRAANITEAREIRQALMELEIPHPNPVIVLVGGADEIGFWDKFPMRKAIRIVAQLAEETGSIVVDGGIQGGIMKEIGDLRKRNNFSFPLLGVVSDGLLMQQEPGSLLEPNHTCFFLIPGGDRGDESAWISKIATVIAGEQKSITVLIHGDEISQTDVEYSLLQERPTYVIRGTGGLADEITLTGKVFAVDISEKPEEILEFLKARLVYIEEASSPGDAIPVEAGSNIVSGSIKINSPQKRGMEQEPDSIETQAGITESEWQGANDLLQRLKLEFSIEIVADWGAIEGQWKQGTWTIVELERLHRTIALISDIMGGSEKFIRHLGGVTVRKADIGSHGGEALAHRVSFSTKGLFSAWTVVHQFAHAWDANYKWEFSRLLEKYTGGSTSPLRSAALRLTRNWDARGNGPENKPGRRGRLPGCNRAGYFYGDKPSGSNWSFNRIEDFAESVAMYVGWERNNDLSEHARSRIVRYTLSNGARDAFGIFDNWADYAKYFYPEDGDYTKTKRWQFVDDLFKGRSSKATKS